MKDNDSIDALVKKSTESESIETTLQKGVIRPSLSPSPIPIYITGYERVSYEKDQYYKGIILGMFGVGFLVLGYGPREYTEEDVGQDYAIKHYDYSEFLEDGVKQSLLYSVLIGVTQTGGTIQYLALCAGLYFTGKIARKITDAISYEAKDLYKTLIEVEQEDIKLIEDKGQENE